MITELLARLRFLILRKKPSELDEELSFHIEQSTAAKQAAGLNAIEARRQAMIELGGVERTREQCARQRPGWWLDTVKRDARHGLRMLCKSPGLMSVVVVTLALGIGANTAVFSLVDGIWLRPLPIADPSHLVAIKSVKNHAAADAEGTDAGSSYGEFSNVREQVPAFSDVAAADRRGMVFQTADGLQLLLAEVVSDNYFTFMGVRPEIGRLPNESELHRIQSPALCADALEHSRAENRPKGVYELELKIKELLPVFGDRPAEEITKQEIVRWLTEQAEARDWKPSSRNRWQAAFSLIFRVGIDNEKITRNPAAGIKRKTENNDKVRFLSDSEEQALFQATDPRFHSHLLLSIHTGIRMSEQYSLKWKQIDFERRQLYLPRTKNGDPRDVPLNGTALQALEELRSVSDGDFVFPHAESPRGWFLGAVERAALKDYTWHCNRHTFASRLVMAGVDLHTVGELLGHRTAQMTKRYAHLSVNHKQAAVERISGVQSAIRTASANLTSSGAYRK